MLIFQLQREMDQQKRKKSRSNKPPGTETEPSRSEKGGASKDILITPYQYGTTDPLQDEFKSL